ncbi:MAG TPA: cation transporter [Acidimicrobiales bacterium]|nr:cation transporter [Acidimicrobiales bacterium]
MPDREADLSPELRSGLALSGVSFSWSLVTSSLAVASGVTSASLVLVAFGAVGYFDAAGSAVLVAHFRHSLRHEILSVAHEDLALRVVRFGLVAVGLASTAEGIRRLVGRSGSHPDALGLGVAAASFVALALLARRKRQLAPRIPSAALAADGLLSATGSLLALVTVLGVALTAALGWWWIDPAAGTAVALGALVVGVRLGPPGRDRGRAGVGQSHDDTT